ncbi:hypothetical protein J4405_05230 [Candidatus Woesearchaeota archaeon]|nr:hypothetical protein [Candidatus Woesearchaeota archaeon]
MKSKEIRKKKTDNASSFYFKLSQEEKNIFRKSTNFILPEKKVFTYDDLVIFAKELLLPIKEKYSISFDELFKLIKEQLLFPAEIFNEKLTVLESVVKYLKEEKGLSLSKISDIIGRDKRNIWHTYDEAKKKYSERFSAKNARFLIPASIFADSRLSALESAVVYLKEEFSLNYHEIAILLKRDDRTIWTVYQRAKKKC